MKMAKTFALRFKTIDAEKGLTKTCLEIEKVIEIKGNKVTLENGEVISSQEIYMFYTEDDKKMKDNPNFESSLLENIGVRTNGHAKV